MLIVSEHYWPAQQLQLPTSTSSSSASDDPLNNIMDTDDNNNNSKGLKHANSIQQQLDEYNAAYHNLKKPRKLYSLPQHGAVEVELTFDDHVQTQRSFLCSPIQADVVPMQQQEADSLSADKAGTSQSSSQTVAAAAVAAEGGEGGATASSIATQLHITEEEATAVLLFWKTRHVSIAHPTVAGCYIVDEEQARWAEDQAVTRKVSAAAAGIAMDDDDDKEAQEEDSNMLELSFPFEKSPNNHHAHNNQNNAANTEQKRKAPKQYATSFVTGLLRSHGGMPIDRLQPLVAVTLRAALEADPEGLTSSDLSFAWSKGALMRFMQQYLVNEGIVDCVSGVYSMPVISRK